MNTKKRLFITLAAVVAVGMIGFAGDERRPESVRTDKDIARPEGQMQAEPGTGERAPLQLEPGLAKIEADYTAQLETLRHELAAAITEEQREAIQERAVQLKVQWTLALADRQLELARQEQNAEAETEILKAMQAMQNPRSTARQEVERDPNAGIVIEGGAK